MINCDEARVFPCQDCGVMRSKAEGGNIFTVCDACWDRTFRDPARVRRLSTLAHNLAVAAGLCRAWDLGAMYERNENYCSPLAWSPGCRRWAP
jgi:hypothetical protein